MQQKFIDQTGTVAFTSFITQQDGRWKNTSNLVLQLLASQWFCQPRPLGAFSWLYPGDAVVILFDIIFCLTSPSRSFCQRPENMNVKRGSRQSTQVIALSRLLHINVWPPSSLCCPVAWALYFKQKEHNQGAREWWPSHHPLRWDAVIVSRWPFPTSFPRKINDNTSNDAKITSFIN